MANRDSSERSSPELVSNLTIVNGSTLKEGTALQPSGEGLNEYHHPVSPDDLSPAVDGVLKSDVCSKSISTEQFLSDPETDCNQYLAL